MTHMHANALALSLTALFAGQATATPMAEPTRAQVRADLAEAVHNGDVATSQSGLTWRQQFPHLYPDQTPASSLSRAEVREELAESIRMGDVVIGESAVRVADVFPQNYPAQSEPSASREQVRAELAAAVSDGSHYQHIEP